MDVTKGMGRDCRRDLNRGVKNAPGSGPHPEQCQKRERVTAVHALHSHGAGRWEMRGLQKRPGHPEVKPELPEGISHLSLGQRLPSSTTAVAAARPMAVQDLAQASDAFSPGFKDSGGSWHWLFLTVAEAHPARKRGGRHVCPECLQARDGTFWQTDGGNFQKALLMDAQGSGQHRLPAHW